MSVLGAREMPEPPQGAEAQSGPCACPAAGSKDVQRVAVAELVLVADECLKRVWGGLAASVCWAPLSVCPGDRSSRRALVHFFQGMWG